MAWTTPPDFTAGAVVTEAQLDNLSANLTSGVERALADTVLASPAATVDFSSIPATFRGLRVEINARSDNLSTTVDVMMRFNNVTSATQYHTQGFYNWSSNIVFLEYAGSLSGIVLGAIPAASASQANQFGAYVTAIPDYLGTTGLKTAVTVGSMRYGGAGAGGQRVYLMGGTWDNTAAVNRLTLFPSAGNFATGSRFTLIGIPAI